MDPTSLGVKGTGTAPRIPYQFRPQPAGVPGLSPTELVVFTAILDDAKRRAWRSRISNAALAAIVGRTTMTVKRCLAALEGRGLIRREMIAGGRIRLAIHVTWEGVEHRVSTVQEASGTPPFHARNIGVPPLEHGGSTIQSPPQSRSTDGGRCPEFGRPETPAVGAAYLKACVAAAKAGEPMPEPPGFANYEGVPPSMTREFASDAPSGGSVEFNGTPRMTPTVPADVFVPSVGRMVAALGERLKAESVGRRRVGPKRLAAQLAEVRRRHGRRE